MKDASMNYDSYSRTMKQIADLKHASAVLQWDQETYLPESGAEMRGQQLSTLAEMSHSLFLSEELGRLLENLSDAAGLEEHQKRNIQRTTEDYSKNKKYSSDFVGRLSRQVNKTYHAWIEARRNNNFRVYEPELEKLISLKLEEADLLGYSEHPYDALLDEFEKGATVKMLDGVFSNLLPQLSPLLAKIKNAPQVNDDFLFQHFPRDQQWKWSLELLEKLGFDFSKGRQDISEHPFSTSFNAHDVRVTTRIDENDFANMTWSCIHEAGHGLYEQGLPFDQYGLPLGEACSYSIHESQSRLWENNVGRSRAFVAHFLPTLKTYFPTQLKEVDVDDFFRAINKVQPSLIRTEADEAITYHFHVFIRYELEKQLLSRSLKTKDIPDFWNEHYSRLLGVKVPDDKRGCLQDVHWSHGSFGYFPTYSLGSFYAAQFFYKASGELSNLDNQMESGEFQPLLNWLRAAVHSKGRYFNSEELCHEITGKGLDVSYFMDYLLQKYETVYTL